MDSRGKVLVIVVIIVVVLAGISVIALANLEKVQEIYEGLTNQDTNDEPENEEGEEDTDGNGGPETPPGESKPISEVVQRLLSSHSLRSITGMTTIVSASSEFYPLIGTPIATCYNGQSKDVSPLLISGSATSYFLEVYNTSEIISIGDSVGTSSYICIPGDEKTSSLEAAKQIWSRSDGALLIEKSKKGFEIGVAATVLASYLNIPVIVTNIMDNQVSNTLSQLGVSYTLVCGNLGGYKDTYFLSSLDDVHTICVEFLKGYFGGVSYITITNSEDVYSQHGIAGISCLASYLSASREGLVLNCPFERLPANTFQMEGQAIADAASNSNQLIKTEFEKLLTNMESYGVYSRYVNQAPYLAILGDPYSIPFYYFENPDPSIYPSSDDAWIATDDYYADLDEDPYHVELAAGRVLALSTQGVAALISRSIFYDQYMSCWEADSRVNDLENCEWKDTAYVAKGDDWNGAMWVSTSDYWVEVNYLRVQGYTVHTTQRRATGATVSQGILHYYSSSSMIYVMAHGSPDSYQMVDSVESSEVRGWEMGPSVQILTSCSAARTDVPDIENTISLTFIEVGTNAYIGGTRTENAGASPTLSSYAIESMVSSDESVGIACRDAKNKYMEGRDDNYEESAIRILYGDPAFNPYQP